MPATIAILGGTVRVGLGPSDLARLARSEHVHKVSRRDLPIVVALETMRVHYRGYALQ